MLYIFRITCFFVASFASSQKIDLKKYNITNVYNRLEDILENNMIDSFYIASPNVLHYEQLLAVIEAEKNVLCDKELSVS